MALLRFGFLADLLSHAVISGYTSAAALIIIADQVRHLLGLPLPRQGVFYQSITGLMGGWQPNVYTACLGLASVGFLLISKDPLRRLLKRLGLSDGQVVPLVQGAPLALVAAAAIWVWGMGWADGAGVAIVGTLPRGLPSLAVPSFSADITRSPSAGTGHQSGELYRQYCRGQVADEPTPPAHRGQLGAAWPRRCQRGCRPVWRRGRYRRTEPFTGQFCRRRKHGLSLGYHGLAHCDSSPLFYSPILLPTARRVGSYYCRGSGSYHRSAHRAAHMAL